MVLLLCAIAASGSIVPDGAFFWLDSFDHTVR